MFRFLAVACVLVAIPLAVVLYLSCSSDDIPPGSLTGLFVASPDLRGFRDAISSAGSGLRPGAVRRALALWRSQKSSEDYWSFEPYLREPPNLESRSGLLEHMPKMPSRHLLSTSNDSTPIQMDRAPWEANWNNSIALCAIMQRENITDIVEWLSYYKYVPRIVHVAEHSSAPLIRTL